MEIAPVAKKAKLSRVIDVRVPEIPKAPASSSNLLISANALSLPSVEGFDLFEGQHKSFIVAGQDATAHWVSSNQEQGSEGPPAEKGYACEYAVAVYRKSSHQLDLLPAAVHVVQPLLKAHLRKHTDAESQLKEDRAAQRADLGIAFGSKKAQRNIRAADRNRLDVTSTDMQSYQSLLQSTLDEVLEGMPSVQEVDALQGEGKPAPRPHPEATTAAEVYPLDEIVPADVLQAIPIKAFLECESQPERLAKLPVRHIGYVNERLDALFSSGSHLRKSGKHRLRWLVYFNYLCVVALGHELKGVESRLQGRCPEFVLEHLLEAFSEGGRQAKQRRITSHTQTKACLHLLALALHIDGFSVELKGLAEDLNVNVQSMSTMFKSLGCQISYPPAEGVKGEGKSPQKGGKLAQARAILKLPLVFPQPKHKRKRA